MANFTQSISSSFFISPPLTPPRWGGGNLETKRPFSYLDTVLWEKRFSYLKLFSTISGASLPAMNDEPVSRFDTVTRAGLNSMASIL